MSRFSITPTGAVTRLEDYLAMGDSYISGEGAFAYRDGTDTSENKCHQSTLSYPYLIGTSFESFASVACSGAVIDNIIGDERQSDDYQVKVKPTQNLANLALEDHVPGYILQRDFLNDNPQAVTISIGGNDVGFKDIITRCIVPFNAGTSTAQTCYQTYEDRLELLNTIDEQFNRLVGTYQTLRGSDPTRRVYVIGYPQIVSDAGSCGLNVRMNAIERVFANQLTSYLDSVIEKAAAKAGVLYVSTQAALDGHKLCEDGTKAVNGLTAGDDKLFLGNESYHPNALGHQLLEGTIMSATDGLKAPMPPADSTAQVQKPIDSLPILQVPKTNRAINEVLNAGQDIMDAVAGTSLSPGLDTFKGILLPNSDFTAVLHSNPLNLGTYHVDANSQLTNDIVIPSGTPAGFHTLHLYGKDIAGNAIDVQQTVYVKVSSADYDGDGIANVNDSCQYLPNSEVDIDQDGIDDACDPDIGAAPVIIQPTDNNGASGTSEGGNGQFAADPAAPTDEPSITASVVGKPTPTLQLAASVSAPAVTDATLSPTDAASGSVLGTTAPSPSSSTNIADNIKTAPKPSFISGNLAQKVGFLSSSLILLLGCWYLLRRKTA
jgi:lysophospholipase L1-like esterase